MEERRTDTIFDRLNTNDLAAKLKIVETARGDAVNERPDSSQTNIQGSEGEIVNFIARKRRDVVDATRGLLDSLSDQRRRIDPSTVKQQLLSIPGDCEIAIDRLNASHSAKLDSLTDQVKKQKKDYDLFRQQNKLSRVAHYPDSKILHYAIIAAIVILETLANAYFFQRGSELGYLGGIQQAFVFSLINVFLAIFVGDNLFRFKNHVEFSHRMWGWISLAGYVMASLFFNLLIGHYRAALQRTVVEDIDPMLAFQMAYDSFRQNPLGISDVEAWILVIMGVLIGLIAFVKAYKADDPYPRYGDVQRRYDELRSELDDTVRRMQESVENTIDEARNKAQRLPTDLKAEHRKLLGLLQDASSVPGRMTSTLHDLQDVCNELLRLYQNENTKIRQSPAPSYFWSTYEYTDELSLDDVSLEDENKYAKALGEEIEALSTDIQSIKDRLKVLNREALEKISSYAI